MPEFTDDELDQIIESAGPRGNSVRNKINALLEAADAAEDPEGTTDALEDTGDGAPADPVGGESTAGGDHTHQFTPSETADHTHQGAVIGADGPAA